MDDGFLLIAHLNLPVPAHDSIVRTPPQNMTTFNDTTGRTWTISINVDAIRRVRSLLNVNRLDAVDGKLLEQLVVDPVLLCDILFALVKPEADAKNVTDEDFGRALGGDALDHATTALLEGLAD